MPKRLIEGAAFDPETTQLLGQAYERACENVDDNTVRTVIAKRIINAAQRGERDLDELVEYGLGMRDSGAAEAC